MKLGLYRKLNLVQQWDVQEVGPIHPPVECQPGDLLVLFIETPGNAPRLAVYPIEDAITFRKVKATA